MRWILLAVAVVIAAGAVALLWLPRYTLAPGGTVCTADAMQCPDGSYVGRTGPNCEFVCPTGTSTASSTTGGAPVVGAGQHCGGFIQNAPVCAEGYYCQLSHIPDTGGTCQPNAAGGTGIAPYQSGIAGTVMLGPTCPVERNPPDPQCADKPYSTLVAVFRASDPVHAYALTTSAADGTFKVSLPPGSYVVGAGNSNLPRCVQTPATVGATGYTSIVVSCDTGIR